MAEASFHSDCGQGDFRRYIMIGDPVTSVRTPPLLEAELRAAGIEAEVLVRQVKSGELEPFMAACMSDLTIDGLMVTMPHKKTIMPYLASLSETASRVQSVNAVKRLASGDLVGAQFDGVALIRAVLAKNIDIEACRVLLAGVGGAGLAIAHALADHGCRGLVIAETEAGQRDAALTSLAERCAFPLGVFEGGPGLGEAEGQDFDLLINATPLGMGERDPSPFEARLLERAKCVADIVADPNDTKLANLTRNVGAILVTGRQMVNAQVAPIAAWLNDPHGRQHST